ncbi:hypothetical protein H4R19_002041 [Coemansia spiralis]|nr:hypothetical protein H4R19_002041 [Coemansia spiralis]
MRAPRIALVLVALGGACLGYPATPDPRSLQEKQAEVVQSILPVIALGFLQEAAGAFSRAGAGAARASQAIVFAIANLPVGRHALELGAVPNDREPNSHLGPSAGSHSGSARLGFKTASDSLEPSSS